MKRVARTEGVALLLAATACGASDGGGSGSIGPVSIQPQPIPSDGFAESFVTSTLTATASSGGLDLHGVITDSTPPGSGFSKVMSIAAFDATSSGAIASASSDASGAFTVHVAGATLGDRLFLFFPADTSLGSALDVASGDPTHATSPCVTIDNVFALQVPATTSASESVGVSFSSSCSSAALTVDHLSSVGDRTISVFPPGFAIPASGASDAQTFRLSPPSGGAFVTYVVLAAGSDRHVVALRGTGP